ncbi:hypothetical protein L228DRAFT_235684 [Xylona heveae TC161]|uniref:BZIP domain-containing protein n=1 Tax=Xylona heveae (strain CBS 132557 / TC161) TaxID=1328760 RepID=A0A165JUA7_XYLHT|nr:hypothetical protein L228DRAFT_235684 [Xylona heveae TC161]KZF26637.1 hypothetical protein L228DRAFT_235684 [Xylona heveae TC161]
MAGVVQGYLPPTLSDTLPTPGFFTAALADSEDQNVFDAAFRSGAANTDKEQEFARTQMNPASSFMRLNGNEAAPSPQSIDPQASLQNDFFSSVLWDGASLDKTQPQSEKQFQAALGGRGLTPPSSLDHSPDEWSFDGLSAPGPLNLKPLPLEDAQQQQPQRPTSTSRFGQVTPPEEASPVLGPPQPTFQDEVTEANGSGPKSPQEAEAASKMAAPKRKRTKQTNPSANAGEEASPKRRRKQSTNVKSEPTEEEKQLMMAAMSKEHPGEDPKRSRFLERNRLAASKCRQKKKEWTSNLETRARDLQNEKNQLALMCGSLREEVLYLKGELLKHSSCGCASIRDYLNREVSNLSRSKDAGYSPFGPGRAASLDIGRSGSNPSFEEMVARRISLPVGFASGVPGQDLAASPAMSALPSVISDGGEASSQAGSSAQSPAQSETLPTTEDFAASL